MRRAVMQSLGLYEMLKTRWLGLAGHVPRQPVSQACKCRKELWKTRKGPEEDHSTLGVWWRKNTELASDMGRSEESPVIARDGGISSSDVLTRTGGPKSKSIVRWLQVASFSQCIVHLAYTHTRRKHGIAAVPSASLISRPTVRYWLSMIHVYRFGCRRKRSEICNAIITNGWLGRRVVSVLDSDAEGSGFKSQSRRCRVTVLGKLFTPIVPLFTMQQNW